MKPRVLLHSKTFNPAVSFHLAPAVKMYMRKFLSLLDRTVILTLPQNKTHTIIDLSEQPTTLKK